MNTMILSNIPKELIEFLLVTVFSLLIGLSQRKLHPVHDESRLFGTDRTFTFIGILGFVLYKVDNDYLALFAGGGIILAVLLAIFYFSKIRDFKDYGLTSIIIALITYCLTPLMLTQPMWLFLLVLVVVLILAEMKQSLMTLTTRLDKEEFITLGKFIFIAGVILPMLPDTPIFPGITLTAYKIWLAVVVISSISYFSYLLQKFVFRDAGILVSGILGGLYSSTATTVILARKSKENPAHEATYVAAMLLAMSMMYGRILILALVFSRIAFLIIWPWMLAMMILSLIVALGFVIRFKKKASEPKATQEKISTNPLEFKVAMLFALLYVVFFIATYYTIQWFGSSGLTILSLITGISDIDPFLISLFQGKFQMAVNIIAASSMLAIVSNNVVKMGYAMFFSKRSSWKMLWLGFGIIIVANILIIFVI